jgi:hypothetical protein
MLLVDMFLIDVFLGLVASADGVRSRGARSDPVADGEAGSTGGPGGRLVDVIPTAQDADASGR